MATMTVHCESCEMLSINGVPCHETGCPDAWKGRHECAECGSGFEPVSRYNDCCSHSCAIAYRGMSCDCSECCPSDDA